MTNRLNMAVVGCGGIANIMVLFARLTPGITLSASCGAAMVVKGTEFYVDGTFTSLTAEKFTPKHQAIGRINRRLELHTELFDGRENGARIGVIHPGEKLHWHWDRLILLYIGSGQVLLTAGIPWRVVTSKDNFTGLDVVLTFDGPISISGVINVHVPFLPGLSSTARSFWERHPIAHNLASTLFKLPTPEDRKNLLAALPEQSFPYGKFDMPVLVEFW